MNDYIPYGRQNISERDIRSVIKILKSKYLTQGEAVPAFEDAVTRKVDAGYAVAVNSATSALHLGCLALGLGNGDILWTSPTTFVASANCGRYCNATVDFVDIDLESGLICVDRLSEKLSAAEKAGRLPKVLVAVHLAGASCDMVGINRLSKQYGFRVIEDASHAIGGRYRDRSIGSCEYSDLTVFSFHPVKIITTGEGGMVTTNDQSLADRVRRLRSHGITKDPDSFKYDAPGAWSYEQQELGFNYRMTDIQAGLGLSQLKDLDSFVEERNRLADLYRSLLTEIPVEPLKVSAEVRSSYHLAVIRVLNKSAQEHRAIFDFLRERGIGVQLHYSPVHLQPYYRELGFKAGDYPNAETYAVSAISLPIFPGLKNSEVEYVTKTLRESIQDG